MTASPRRSDGSDAPDPMALAAARRWVSVLFVAVNAVGF
jgi:hypothetical protein